MQPGIHLVHKPVGVTSFSLVRSFMEEVAAAALPRRLRVCHGGTLDPFAEGLLLLLAGQATRLMDLLHALPKVYVAEVAWGVETDNGDLHGRVVSRGDPAALTPEGLAAALAPFLGWHEQVPPATSAKKVGGEPAYRKAHRGEVVVLPPSRVYLHAARWLSHALPARSTLWLCSRGGFYVRALARDVGRALGCGAHLTRLQRTAIGPWQDPGQEGGRVLVQGRALLSWCAARRLSGEEAHHLRHGRRVPRGTLEPPDWALPEGFPDPRGPVRGMLRERLVALLREEADGTLSSALQLWGGL